MIDITRPGKHMLSLQTPVMNAAGVFGFGSEYAGLLQLDKLGALVTNPISLHERTPARGTRVVTLDAGVLMHTGLPNPGIRRVLKDHASAWAKLPIPLIVHLIATTPDEIKRCIALLDETEAVAGIELGLEDNLTWRVAEQLVLAATENAEKPVLIRLPFMEANDIAETCADAGASALIVAAPPRGIARDARSGQLIQGRVYAPLLKTLTLRLVDLLTRRIPDVPIIGAGGIHTLQDARDFMELGARAIQIDSVIWSKPKMLERIARDLSGKLITRKSDSYADEWHPDMGDTEFAAKMLGAAPAGSDADESAAPPDDKPARPDDTPARKQR